MLAYLTRPEASASANLNARGMGLSAWGMDLVPGVWILVHRTLETVLEVWQHLAASGMGQHVLGRVGEGSPS